MIFKEILIGLDLNMESLPYKLKPGYEVDFTVMYSFDFCKKVGQKRPRINIHGTFQEIKDIRVETFMDGRYSVKYFTTMMLVESTFYFTSVPKVVTEFVTLDFGLIQGAWRANISYFGSELSIQINDVRQIKIKNED